MSKLKTGFAPMVRKKHDAEAERQRLAELARKRSAHGREIGPLPAITNPARRRLCDASLFWFLTCYHRATFYLSWSDDQLETIEVLQNVIERGGQQALAEPRGSGKTSLCVAATEWAVLTARRRFPVLISADEKSATNLLGQMLTDFLHNPELQADYPEALYALARLEGINQRAKGQTLDGQPTSIVVTQNRIVLPTVPGSPCSGSVIEVRGLTASIRGMSHKTHAGEKLRPDLAIIDDPQTDESARSPSQCHDRETLINGAVLGLADPSIKFAAIAAVTVIRPDDLADRLLSREISPEWQGVRHKLAKSLPDRLDLWDEYGQIRAQCLREGRPTSEATSFYLANQAEMDRGCRPSWHARKNYDEVSAVQNIMNLRLRDPVSFASEYQNEPLVETRTGAELSPLEVAGKLSYYPHRVVPDRATRLTMGVDVQGNVLFFVVVAWCEDNTGYIIDYGCWPEQRREYFTLRDVTNTLQKKIGSEDLATCVFGGLSQMIEGLRPYYRADGVEVPMSRVLIDGAWGPSTDAVRRFCERYQRTKPVMVAFGRYLRASQMINDPMRPRAGDRGGLGWKIPKPTQKSHHVLFDSNLWKAETHKRLRMVAGAPGSLTLWGDKPTTHRMIVDHLLSEKVTIVSANGVEIEEFNLRSGLENHYLDCLSMASVGASIEGITSTSVIRTETNEVKKERKRVKYSEVAAKKIAAYQATR